MAQTIQNAGKVGSDSVRNGLGGGALIDYMQRASAGGRSADSLGSVIIFRLPSSSKLRGTRELAASGRLDRLLGLPEYIYTVDIVP